MFFEPKSYSERQLSMDYFREWANEIAHSYLNARALPTETLCKIAQSEDLTPHQIQVLAGEANKEIHRIKFAGAKEKYFAADFPLADAAKAIAALQVDGGEAKLATALPPPRFTKKEPDLFELFGVDKLADDQSGLMLKSAEVKQNLKVASAQAKLLDQKISDEQFLTKMAMKANEQKFIKEARKMVIAGDNSTERMKILGTIDCMAKTAKVDFARYPLAKLAYILGKEGLLLPGHAKKAIDYFMAKEADVTAPAELVSGWLPQHARVINGNHPLYITLKTIDMG